METADQIPVDSNEQSCSESNAKGSNKAEPASLSRQGISSKEAADDRLARETRRLAFATFVAALATVALAIITTLQVSAGRKSTEHFDQALISFNGALKNSDEALKQITGMNENLSKVSSTIKEGTEQSVEESKTEPQLIAVDNSCDIILLDVPQRYRLDKIEDCSHAYFTMRNPGPSSITAFVALQFDTLTCSSERAAVPMRATREFSVNLDRCFDQAGVLRQGDLTFQLIFRQI